ncbi:hypothetical protein VN97_g8640 [Penicillium thymicola]|uniref:Uncharacterized protein n=1 Tax=Penicillium thymicola TaxID=293382 RepID=A0AAI9TCE3_PENTH|nr:hypothetical protein VN97_g8640 [Penicillium thymicola]
MSTASQIFSRSYITTLYSLPYKGSPTSTRFTSPLLAAITAWHLNSILSIRSDRNSSGYSITITLSSSNKSSVPLVVCLKVLSYITIGSYSLLRRKESSITIRII